MKKISVASAFLILAMTLPPLQAAPGQLSGWGYGEPAKVVPDAADVGFNEIIIWQRKPESLKSWVEAARKYNIGIYSVVTLASLEEWKTKYPQVPPPLQEMNAEENAGLQRIKADTTKWKSNYQYGGEPLQPWEVLEAPLLCFHHAEVGELYREQIKEILSTPGLRGIAFDYFGYQNYRCCRCKKSMAAFTEWFRGQKDLSREKGLEKFSLETLANFNNALADFARSIRPDIKTASHVYPVFLPEPLYGNRLDIDYCAQTVAWLCEPLWGLEKIRSYTAGVIQAEKKYFSRAEGVAFMGYCNHPDIFPVKNVERVELELKAILESGADRVHVYILNDVLRTKPVREVFKKYFKPPP